MEHYLLRLTYSTAGWQDIVNKAAGFDQRMALVRNLIAHLGGSFASFHFYDTPAFKNESLHHVVTDKFAMFGGHDLMAVLAMPDKQAAKAFTAALSAQHGIDTIRPRLVDAVRGGGHVIGDLRQGGNGQNRLHRTWIKYPLIPTRPPTL